VARRLVDATEAALAAAMAAGEREGAAGIMVVRPGPGPGHGPEAYLLTCRCWLTDLDEALQVRRGYALFLPNIYQPARPDRIEIDLSLAVKRGWVFKDEPGDVAAPPGG
jgi:hypothetical protein